MMPPSLPQNTPDKGLMQINKRKPAKCNSMNIYRGIGILTAVVEVFEESV